MRPLRPIALLALSLPIFAPTARADDQFYLKDGDRVVFYGDSITEQRLYTTFVETYVVTRFPKADVKFVHSGWSGDRVTGGGGGPIDVRLKRDVFAYKPTVMTVMLGMNDAGNGPFDPKIFETYSKGYEHIVDAAKTELPDLRLTLIEPSPYDDVTRPPAFEGGYNAVLIRYGDFVKDLARKNHLDFADLNTSVVDATKAAFASDPENAKKLNPDRVHPAPSGQLLMAAALLKAWKAPAIVSKVSIKIGDDVAKADAAKAEVTDLEGSNSSVRWTQRDESLPFPINLKDPIIDLAARSSDVVQTLDAQLLQVSGLTAGDYTLKIDDKDLGTFNRSQLADGINLATLPTPMFDQAVAVHNLTLKHNDLHFHRWRAIQAPPITDNEAHIAKAIEALDAIEADIVKAQRKEAQPKPHKFELTRKAS